MSGNYDCPGILFIWRILKLKRVICCLMAAVLLFGTVGCAASVAPVTPDEVAPEATVTQAPGDVVVFDDAALEASIREALGKPEGDITR